MLHFPSLALLAALTAQAADPVTRADQPLAALEPLIGDWASEAMGPDGTKIARTITYKWIFDRKFLQAESERRVGEQSVRMVITYFYDAPARKIRAWVVASDGSWSEADVEASQDAVRLDTKGAGPDGAPLSLISTLRATGDGTRSEEWSDIKVGGRPQPSPPPIVWKRR